MSYALKLQTEIHDNMKILHTWVYTFKEDSPQLLMSAPSQRLKGWEKVRA